MDEQEKRLHRCCFTGHRPDKLHISEALVIERLRISIERAINDGFCTFLTGMCWGVDIWAGELVLQYRKVDSSIHLICALPHPDFEKRWSAEWQKRYRAVKEQADLVRTICSNFSYRSYQIRNEWLVDHSARIICAYNGEPGGTRNTIQYAQKRGIEIDYLDMKGENE